MKTIILLLMICVITGCECKGSMPNSMTGQKPHWPMCGWEQLEIASRRLAQEYLFT